MRDQTLRIAVRQFEPFSRSVAEMWDDYCAQTGCSLTIDAVSMDLYPLYNAMIGNGGMKAGDWDICMINTDWIAEAYEEGHLLDLKSMLAANPPENYPQGWTESLLAFQDFRQAVVALPFHDGPECLIYRTDLFANPVERQTFRTRTGQELSVPKTWDEFVTVARHFNRPDQNRFGTVFAAYPDGHNTVFDFSLQVWTRGGELVDNAGRVIVDSPAARDGMAFYRKILGDHSAIHPKCREMDSVKAGLAFACGEVAMMINWFGFASMSEVVPESVIQGKVDVADVPYSPGGASASLNCYWMYAIAAGSPHPETAYDFIRFMVGAENDKRLTLNGGTGCRKSTWHDPAVNAAVPYTHRLEDLHANARTLPRLANWAELAGVVDRLVLDTINTDRPINQILADAQTKIDAIQETV